jgi:putative ABC transport system substrate-binding protein
MHNSFVECDRVWSSGVGDSMRRREFITLLGGAVAFWPLAARAQQAGKIPRIGVLWHAGSALEEQPYYKALLEGFAALGYIEGKNIKFEHRFPNETPELYTRMAAELVSLNVDVLVASGNNAAPFAKKATATIPIVFMVVADPIGLKLVDSYPRPGGNVTGFSTYSPDLIGRRLQLLKETMPGLARVAVLVNPSFPGSVANIEMSRTAAAQLELVIQTFEARPLEALEPVFDGMAHMGMQAVTVHADGMAFQGRNLIPKLGLARGMALCAYSRETFEPGALMSYGTDQIASVRRTATYVDKILKGAKPSDLPVEGPNKFEFLINLKTAKALGIDVPSIMLSRADEVIE